MLSCSRQYHDDFAIWCQDSGVDHDVIIFIVQSISIEVQHLLCNGKCDPTLVLVFFFDALFELAQCHRLVVQHTLYRDPDSLLQIPSSTNTDSEFVLEAKRKVHIRVWCDPVADQRLVLFKSALDIVQPDISNLLANRLLYLALEIADGGRGIEIKADWIWDYG